MKRNNRFLAFGQLSFVLGFLGFLVNEHYFNGLSILAFFSGLCFGLSLVLNLAYLVKRRSHTITQKNPLQNHSGGIP